VGHADVSGKVVRNIGAAVLSSCTSAQAAAIVRNNLVSGGAAAGIQQRQDATNSTIVNSTVFRSRIDGLIGGGDAGALPHGSENNVVANNLSTTTLLWNCRWVAPLAAVTFASTIWCMRAVPLGAQPVPAGMRALRRCRIVPSHSSLIELNATRRAHHGRSIVAPSLRFNISQL
jgi:hypothetical protein